MRDFCFQLPTINERLKAVIAASTDESGRFGWLQKKTGISRTTWQTWWDKEGAAPGGRLIEAASRLWPEYAFWIATGIVDLEYGHRAPKTVPNSTTWPAYGGTHYPDAPDFFRQCVVMQEKEIRGEYEDSAEWERDWAKLDALSWEREIKIHAMRLIFGSYEDRLRTKPAKVNPWYPDDGDGIHPSSE